MDILMNHCWCSDSNWGGMYDCRVIVSIDMIAKGKSYYDPLEPDWINLIEEDDNFTFQDGAGFTQHGTQRLKPEVIQWLKDNVKDKRWAVGTDDYNSRNQISFTVFFQSSRDALKFIKRWSSHKNVVRYFNYFKDIRRELNPKTGRLQKKSS